MTTGRKCDGYQSPLQSTRRQFINYSQASEGVIRLVAFPRSTEPSPQDVEFLNRCFSIKTLLGVRLDCDEEAKRLLKSSLVSEPVRHAIETLRVLRGNLDSTTDGRTAMDRHSPGYDYGLQQYNMAIRGLGRLMGGSGPGGPTSALLCCQVFMSIDQVLGNYDTMFQHFTQGLGIMRECRARSMVIDGNRIIPASYPRLPLLDVFVIKLYTAPCKFAEPVPEVVAVDDQEPSYLSKDQRYFDERHVLPRIAPDHRKNLLKIAASTLEFLSRASSFESMQAVAALRREKNALLDSLDSWLLDLQAIHPGVSRPGAISILFLRLFHQILRLVVLGSIDYLSRTNARLAEETGKLQHIVKIIKHSVQDYRMPDRRTCRLSG